MYGNFFSRQKNVVQPSNQRFCCFVRVLTVQEEFDQAISTNFDLSPVSDAFVPSFGSFSLLDSSRSISSYTLSLPRSSLLNYFTSESNTKLICYMFMYTVYLTLCEV